MALKILGEHLFNQQCGYLIKTKILNTINNNKTKIYLSFDQHSFKDENSVENNNKLQLNIISCKNNPLKIIKVYTKKNNLSKQNKKV